MPTEQENFMAQALALAAEAAAAGEVPVGCVIVRDGEIVGRGRNRREEKQATASHAEMEAIAQANEHLGTWRLDDCELYVTLEPCPMCAGGYPECPYPPGLVRRPGRGLRCLRRRDQPVYGELPQPARPGGRHSGRGLPPGAGGFFCRAPGRRKKSTLRFDLRLL